MLAERMDRFLKAELEAMEEDKVPKRLFCERENFQACSLGSKKELANSELPKQTYLCRLQVHFVSFYGFENFFDSSFVCVPILPQRTSPCFE